MESLRRFVLWQIAGIPAFQEIAGVVVFMSSQVGQHRIVWLKLG